MFSPAELWALNTGAGHSVMHEWLDCWLCCQHYLKACSRYTHICTQTHTKLQLCIRWVVFLIYNYDTFTALRLFVRFKLSIQLVKNTAVIGYLGDLVSCGIVWECEEGLMWLLLCVSVWGGTDVVTVVWECEEGLMWLQLCESVRRDWCGYCCIMYTCHTALMSAVSV